MNEYAAALERVHRYTKVDQEHKLQTAVEYRRPIAALMHLMHLKAEHSQLVDAVEAWAGAEALEEWRREARREADHWDDEQN